MARARAEGPVELAAVMPWTGASNSPMYTTSGTTSANYYAASTVTSK